MQCFFLHNTRARTTVLWILIWANSQRGEKKSTATG